MRADTEYLYDRQVMLDYKLKVLKKKVGEKVLYNFTYLTDDETGADRKRISYTGYVKNIRNERDLVLTDGTVINTDQIIKIDSRIFED